MSANDQRRLSARAVVREVVDSYRAHWLFLIPMAVVILLPQALADGFLDHLQLEGIHSVRDIAILAATPLTVVINLGGQAFYAGLTAAAVVEWREHRPLPNIHALLRAVPIKRLIALDLILSFGSALGFLLLVIPGLLVLAWFSLSPAITKFEHRGVWDSLRRSREIVRGNFWPVMWIVVGTIIVTELLVEAVSVPFHSDLATAFGDLVADGLLQPIEGLVIVVVALQLLELRGELPDRSELARSVGDVS